MLLPQVSKLADRIIDVTPNQKAMAVSVIRDSGGST